MDLYESTRKRKSERIFLVLHEGVERKKKGKKTKRKKSTFFHPPREELKSISPSVSLFTR